MVRRLSNPYTVISPAEAEKAIYVDCEGFEDQSPSLIGVLIGDELEQIVLDPELQPVAIARCHRVISFGEEASRLRHLSTREDRLVVAFSQHEKNLFSTYAQIDISERYRDARMIAKKWRNRLYPDIPIDGWDLKAFLKFIGFSRGTYLGHRRSTKRIKAVRDMIRTRGSYEALTSVTKAKWTKLLQHNEIDCRGMRALVVRAAIELAVV